jgi:hypothetical protein
MRRASAALGRPGAAAEIADLIAGLVPTSPPTPRLNPPGVRLETTVSRPPVLSPSLSTGAGPC